MPLIVDRKRGCCFGEHVLNTYCCRGLAQAVYSNRLKEGVHFCASPVQESNLDSLMVQHSADSEQLGFYVRWNIIYHPFISRLRYVVRI